MLEVTHKIPWQKNKHTIFSFFNSIGLILFKTRQTVCGKDITDVLSAIELSYYSLLIVALLRLLLSYYGIMQHEFGWYRSHENIEHMLERHGVFNIILIYSIYLVLCSLLSLVIRSIVIYLLLQTLKIPNIKFKDVFIYCSLAFASLFGAVVPIVGLAIAYLLDLRIVSLGIFSVAGGKKWKCYLCVLLGNVVPVILTSIPGLPVSISISYYIFY